MSRSPVRPLSDKSKLCSSTKLLNNGGMPPTSPLLLIFNAMPSFTNLPNDEGILPPRTLPPSCSSISISNCERESGMPPLNLFSCNRSCDRNLRLLTVVSAEPFKELKLKSSKYSLEQLEICTGRTPCRLFCERFSTLKFTKSLISDGIGPTNLFSDHFIIVIFTHLPKLAGMLPLKEL
ncbi:hypothetical protein EE612_044599 [Oryza sativa]|nr:hypothetical protein EE612_044599 [Oryza sativa]